MKPLAVHHVSINVDDVPAALAFYTGVLGLELREDRPDFGFGGAWLDAGGQQVHLIEAPVPANRGQHFALAVGDLAATVGELRARGVTVSDPVKVGTGLQSFVNDPAGNTVELQQPAGQPGDDIAAFLAGARTVLEALSDPRVADAWDSPSVLEGQAVSGLAGHLARGGVWVVADYLAGGEPEGPVTFDSAGAYYARLAEHMADEDHAAVRRRGAQVGADGQEALVRTLTERLDELIPLLAAAGPDRRLAVIGGAVLRLGDYLRTRIVEQVVHLGDLARSVGAEDWALPSDCVATALAVGLQIGRIRFGDQDLVRALFRDTGSEVLPVL